MELMKCPECGREISDKVESCPNCGMKLQNNGKILKIVGIIILVSVLVAMLT